MKVILSTFPFKRKANVRFFSGIQHAWVEGDRYCFRRWERYSIVGKAGENSITLASFTQPTVLLAACIKIVHVLSCSMYLLELMVPIAIVLEVKVMCCC